MYPRHLVLTLAFFAVTLPAIAQEMEPKELVSKAVEAMAGSQDKLKSMNQFISKAHGQIYSAMGTVKSDREIQAALPDTFHMKNILNLGDNKPVSILSVNGTKGYRELNGKRFELSFEELRDVLTDLHGMRLWTLVPLTTNDVTLKSVTTEKVEGADYLVLKVTKRANPEVNLFFDPKSYLLMRMTYIGKEAETNVRKEFLFTQHERFSGLMLPTKWVEKINGKISNTWTITDYKFPEKLNP
jgi:hypothetical protein